MNLIWALFLGGVLVLFGALETYALVSGRVTLSRFVWDLSKAWPPLGWAVGLVTGFVAAHFWWGGSLICY